MTHPNLSSIREIIDTTVSIFDDGPSDSASKLLDLPELGAGTWRAEVASDGLTLDNKLKVEKAISQALREAGFLNIQVYFKRKKGNAIGAKKPGASANRASPFGLKMNKREIPGVGKVILVASGKGGVGKSTIASNLAAGLAARGKQVGFLDADVYGPSATVMFGISGDLDVSEAGLLIPKTSHGVKVMSFGFMADDAQPVIWRGPLVSKALEQFCYQVDWGELDYLVIDMPPGTGDVQITLAETLPNASAIVVTTPQDIALIDAKKGYTLFEKMQVPVLGFVENMAFFECSGCGKKTQIFRNKGLEDFCVSRNIPIISQVPINADVAEACDEGQPVIIGGGVFEDSAMASRRTLSQAFHAVADYVDEHALSVKS